MNRRPLVKLLMLQPCVLPPLLRPSFRFIIFDTHRAFDHLGLAAPVHPIGLYTGEASSVANYRTAHGFFFGPILGHLDET